MHFQSPVPSKAAWFSRLDSRRIQRTRIYKREYSGEEPGNLAMPSRISGPGTNKLATGNGETLAKGHDFSFSLISQYQRCLIGKQERPCGHLTVKSMIFLHRQTSHLMHATMNASSSVPEGRNAGPGTAMSRLRRERCGYRRCEILQPHRKQRDQPIQCLLIQKGQQLFKLQ
jgi:hypothetical protein